MSPKRTRWKPFGSGLDASPVHRIDNGCELRYSFLRTLQSTIANSSRRTLLNQPLHVGTFGCCNVTLTYHAPPLRDLDRVSVIGIADPIEQRRKRVQEC